MFGSRNTRPEPGRQPPQSSQRGSYGRAPSDSSDRYGGGYGGGYARAPARYDGPSEKHDHRSGHAQSWSLQPVKSPTVAITYGNTVAVSPFDFQQIQGELYLILNDIFVVTARPLDNFPQGQISLSDFQRTWAQISLQDTVQARVYNPFDEGGHRYLGSIDADVGLAGRKATDAPFDSDELGRVFLKNYENQVLAPGQKVLMDYRSVPLLFTIRAVQLVDLSTNKASWDSQPTRTDPNSRGILTSQSELTLTKDAKSPINLRSSKKKPPTNAILQANFKFEDMGIGGLDQEFSQIFRRAFASRIFPPGLIEQMGIQHVKGILLYGPPGTGKTLIARQIGKMLNAREPKVINGPEVLNKFVGQSEENVRKLFVDAEKEYKEKGDESGLHIIIFDELDAVCKQRGSGVGGGTGAGDSVVNQLLSKLDGVDQLNNILLIGMTNRKDMIDEALLRPGRLEVHMEISLPDEKGRVQILKIHTAKMQQSGNLDPEVSIDELAHQTKNFSGAEISGLVRSAASFALSRHVKVGTYAGVKDDLDHLTVKREDFEQAFDDVKPAFGVSESEMEKCLRGGIIHFSRFIGDILKEGTLLVKQVQEPDSTPIFSTLLHGPPGSGKTAMAAKIALDSSYPFIKLISPDNMIGFSDPMKIEQMRRVFDDAYKSPLSVVLIDNIERIVEWVPIGPRFSNAVLQALMVLLKKEPPAGRRLLILATTGEESVMKQLGIWTSFDSDIPVPNVGDHVQLTKIIQQSGVFQDPSRAIQELRDLTGSEKVSVGIKKVLLGIETAKQDEDRETRFAETMARAMPSESRESDRFEESTLDGGRDSNEQTASQVLPGLRRLTGSENGSGGSKKKVLSIEAAEQDGNRFADIMSRPTASERREGERVAKSNRDSR